MAINTLSLPVDIPWRRLCVSDDMIDRQICDRRFPFRWRSSVAVFRYDPPDEAQPDNNTSLSYLKIVATITGFQPDGAEVGLQDRRIDSYFNDPATIENYKDIIGAYYPCYGAVLEVAIGPRGDNVRLGQYPYFADFEPKKRELYEIVTETGEVMSRSLEQVGVHKGAVTTSAHEILDVFGGFSQEFTYAGTGGGHSVQGQWGTRDLNQQEFSNIRTTDQARELRETLASTTQLSQMYHQLSSYHLGTNRAVFFLIPRPHVVQSELTFVNGPRRLEGIQEFMLVVIRPKEAPEYCVEAYLETAHVGSVPVLDYERTTRTASLRVEARVEDRDCTTCFGDDGYEVFNQGSETFVPPAGYEVDLEREGGYREVTRSGSGIVEVRIDAARDRVTLFGRVRGEFVDRKWPNDNILNHGLLELGIEVYIRRIQPFVTGYNQTLFLTGRGVCCCEEIIGIREGILLETPIAVSKPLGRDASFTLQEANEARISVLRELQRSRNSGERYPIGMVEFLDAEFVGTALAQVIRRPGHPDNTPVATLIEVPASVRRKVAQVAPRASRGRVLEAPLPELIDRFGLSLDEAKQLKRAALGLRGPVPDPARRWDRPSQRFDHEVDVPDLSGLKLSDAKARLAALRLQAEPIEERDSAEPQGVVLDQRPEPGASVVVGSHVLVVVATGARVQIPDVVGAPLSAGLCHLRDAGLKREPEIEFQPGRERGVILATKPKPRSFVTPEQRVVVVASDGTLEKAPVPKRQRRSSQRGGGQSTA